MAGAGRLRYIDPSTVMEILDWITIRKIQVDCIIGIFAEERTRPQPVRVTLRLGLSPRDVACSQSLDDTVDYLAVTGQVTFLLSSCRFQLIETAAEALASYLIAPPTLAERRAPIRRVVVEIHKPQALPSPATACLTIERAAGAVFKIEEKTFGTVDVIHEAAASGIYRLNLGPGKEIPLHLHQRMEEHELVLTRGLESQGREILPGMAFHWPRGAAHYYRNPTTSHQTILCVDAPRFIPEDEVEVTGEPAAVIPELIWAARDPQGRLIPAQR